MLKVEKRRSSVLLRKSSKNRMDETETSESSHGTEKSIFVWTFLSREDNSPRKKRLHTDKFQRKILAPSDTQHEHQCPKKFHDVFRDPSQLDFFKKFLVSLGDGSEYFLLYILAVNELKQYTLTPDRIMNIFRYIKSFLLGANGEIFLQQKHPLWFRLRRMHNPSISMLVQGQCMLAKLLHDDYFPAYASKFKKEGDKAECTAGKELDTRVRRLSLWNKFIKAVTNFRKGLLDQGSHSGFKTFLLKEIKLCSHNPMRLIGDKVLNTNKLIKDIEFWSEVERYKSMYDDGCHSDTLYRKALTIVSCFLESTVPPRVQINITPDLANSILQDLDTNGATRGLFHDAELAVFITLMIFWRRYLIWRIDFDMKKLPHLPLLPKQPPPTTTNPQQLPLGKNPDKKPLPSVTEQPAIPAPVSKPTKSNRKQKSFTQRILSESSDHFPRITYSLASKRCALFSYGEEVRTYRVHTKSLPTRLPSLYKIK